MWVLPCTGSTTLKITFGAFTATIPYTTLAMGQQIFKDAKGNHYCASAVMFPTGTILTIPQWVIGDVFMTNVYSVFDFGTNAATGGRIGFAQLAGTTSSSASRLLSSSSVSTRAVQALVGVAAAAVLLL